MKIEKHTHVVPMTTEQIADALGLQQAWARFQNATPEEREQWAREAAEAAAAERARHPHVDLTLDGLIEKLGWTRAYAEHFMQPYCECGDSRDGWDHCQHARDEGVVP